MRHVSGSGEMNGETGVVSSYVASQVSELGGLRKRLCGRRVRFPQFYQGDVRMGHQIAAI